MRITAVFDARRDRAIFEHMGSACRGRAHAFLGVAVVLVAALRPRIHGWCAAGRAGRLRRGRPAGRAVPWYLHYFPAKGWVLRWLGTGEVCSDYLSILCQAHDTDRVTETLADYLTGADRGAGGPHAWDLLEIDGIAADDPPVTQLLRWARQREVRHANTP